jgi:hypothetical protein
VDLLGGAQLLEPAFPALQAAAFPPPGLSSPVLPVQAKAPVKEALPVWAGPRRYTGPRRCVRYGEHHGGDLLGLQDQDRDRCGEGSQALGRDGYLWRASTC